MAKARKVAAGAIFLALINWLFPVLAFPWTRVEEGLWVEDFPSPVNSIVGDSRIRVLKIAPAFYSFGLYSVGEVGMDLRRADQWAEAFGLVAVINAGMFKRDRKTSVGFMKNYTYSNNPQMNPTFKAFLAFNPADSSLPKVQIIDREHQEWQGLVAKYHTVIQNYRMVSNKQTNVWSPSKRIYSIACVGTDKKGNVLFIHCRAPYSVHDFNDFLLSLPLDIYNAMYVEGGPEASLYVKTKDYTGKWMGSYESEFLEDDSNHALWPIPNVIGIKKKESKDK